MKHFICSAILSFFLLAESEDLQQYSNAVREMRQSDPITRKKDQQRSQNKNKRAPNLKGRAKAIRNLVKKEKLEGPRILASRKVKKKRDMKRNVKKKHKKRKKFRERELHRNPQGVRPTKLPPPPPPQS